MSRSATEVVYANSPLKCCETCAFRRISATMSDDRSFDTCVRFHESTKMAAKYDCGHELKYWRMAPPKEPPTKRRSLRQWLHDLLFA